MNGKTVASGKQGTLEQQWPTLTPSSANLGERVHDRDAAPFEKLSTSKPPSPHISPDLDAPAATHRNMGHTGFDLFTTRGWDTMATGFWALLYYFPY